MIIDLGDMLNQLVKLNSTFSGLSKNFPLKKILRTYLFGIFAAFLTLLPGVCHATFTGTQKFIVLRVQAHDSTGTTYTATQVQQQFDDITTLWGPHSSYDNITPAFQITSLYTLPKNFTSYVDLTDHSSDAAFNRIVTDAVANAPAGLDWTNLRGIVIYLADTRPNGFHRGVTYPPLNITPPGASSSISVHASLLTEDPQEGLPTGWGRVAHEVGHQLQNGGPPHPSNYASSFEQMDGEYPAQTGVFERQQNQGFPGWLPNTKYVEVHSPTGTATTIWAAEHSPGGQPDPQAIKAYLSFGGNTVYYLISVRRRILGDELAIDSTSSPTDCNTVATPNGIPDCGVLIERVVENGDPNVHDCDPVYGCTNRWVDVLGNGGDPKKLWHENYIYRSDSSGTTSTSSDGISIAIRKKVDPDHYEVYVAYNTDKTAHPDIGMYTWLRPPGNTYETTDIWVDSPVNGFSPVGSPPDPASYRYGVWSDLAGGVVPIGNGDDPAVGMVNRLYARVHNFGTQPATNVVVHFDITDPPGLGINGPNGLIPLGTVDSSSFPALASIPPGGVVDVYYNWTPNFPLTPAQLAAGQFYFHTCVRVRMDAVPGETLLANQDGDGEQENIEYFDATGSTPGAPGAPNKSMVHLRNDSPSVSKTFTLTLLRDDLPPSWKAEVNGGVQFVTLAPGELRDIPVVIKQTKHEAIGSRHQVRVLASSQINFKNAQHKTAHTELRSLGGVTFEVGVLRKTHIECRRTHNGITGRILGLDPKAERSPVYVVQYSKGGKGDEDDKDDRKKIKFGRGVLTSTHGGKFQIKELPFKGTAVCLYAGSKTDTSAASKPF